MLMLIESAVAEKVTEVSEAWFEALVASDLRWSYPRDGASREVRARREAKSAELVEARINAGIYPATVEQASSWTSSVDFVPEIVDDALAIYRETNPEPYADLSLAESIEVEANRYKALGTPAAKLISVRLAELVEEIRSLDAETVDQYDARAEAMLDDMRREGDPSDVADRLISTKYRWLQALATA